MPRPSNLTWRVRAVSPDRGKGDGGFVRLSLQRLGAPKGSGVFARVGDFAPRSDDAVVPPPNRPGGYFPNSWSAAVIRPIVGLAAQYSPSFLAFATSLSVSMSGGSSSSL